jgi:uncharacterized protein (DUF362 family)
VLRAHNAETVALRLSEGLRGCGILPRPQEHWVVKLNLTYPEYIPGVVNTGVFIEGLCQWGRDSRVRLTFIEGDGGNGAYSAADTFDGNGVTLIARRYGMDTRSISETPWEWRETDVNAKSVKLPYSPFFRRREYDRLVSAPLFKTHIFTRVSLGMKNLWGCIPDPYRMYYHHVLDRGIVALFKELAPDFSIFDGIYGLRGNGPMDGEPIPLGIIMVASTVPAGEVAALKAMGIDEAEVTHLEVARKAGLLPQLTDLHWLGTSCDSPLSTFTLRRTVLNHASIVLARAPRLQRLIYHSALSRLIYPIVDRLRPGSAQARLVQGKRQGKYDARPLP